MPRNQWLIIGFLVVCLVACASVLSFMLGALLFRQPNTIVIPTDSRIIVVPAFPTVPTDSPATATAARKALEEIPTAAVRLQTPPITLAPIPTLMPMIRVTSTSVPSRVYHLNEAVTDQGWEYKVIKVEKFKNFTAVLSGNPASVFPAQGIYVGVYFTLKNVSKQNAYFIPSPGNIEIVDTSGTHYDRAANSLAIPYPITPSNANCPNTNSYVPGIVSTCKAIFDVNPSATGLKLHLFSSSAYVALD